MTEKQKQKISEICKRYHFYFCVWFGSAVDPKLKKHSRDYDLAFYGGQALKEDLKFELYKELSPFFKKPVDVILIQLLMDPLLAYEISTKGKLVYESKKDSFLEFQGRAWKDYLDSKRYRDYEKTYLKKRIKNVS